MARMKDYRITFFDRNNIRTDIELVVSADTKGAAIEAARAVLLAKAATDIHMITAGMGMASLPYVNNKGENLTATVRQVSTKYYNTLVNECWGISACDVIGDVAKGVSSERAAATAAAKLEKAQRECDSTLPVSPTKARKRRWTRAEKRAAAAARKSEQLKLVA